MAGPPPVSSTPRACKTPAASTRSADAVRSALTARDLGARVSRSPGRRGNRRFAEVLTSAVLPINQTVPVATLRLRRAIRGEPDGMCREPFHVGLEPLPTFPPGVGTRCDTALIEAANVLTGAANPRCSSTPRRGFHKIASRHRNSRARGVVAGRGRTWEDQFSQ
jgi:hypothetical protein